MDKKKVLFMPGSFSLAHVGRLITLAEALPSDSYEIMFACEQRDQRFIPARFGRRLAKSLPPEEFRRRLEKGHPLIDAPFLRRQVEEDIQLLKSLHADLVVGDFRPSLSISAPVAGVPHMNIVNPESPVGREDRPRAERGAPGAAEPLMRDGKGGLFDEQKSAGRSGDYGQTFL